MKLDALEDIARAVDRKASKLAASIAAAGGPDVRLLLVADHLANGGRLMVERPRQRVRQVVPAGPSDPTGG